MMEPLLEMHRWLWSRFKSALSDITEDEVNWRPLPQANNINLIVRHLRIEAEWHTAGIENGTAMHLEVPAGVQKEIDAVPLDFEHNFKELESLFARFVARLEKITGEELCGLSTATYSEFPGERPRHFLGFHQAVHLAGHLGQITSIRNLYCKTRGEPARFFPDNPTFPNEFLK